MPHFIDRASFRPATTSDEVFGDGDIVARSDATATASLTPADVGDESADLDATDNDSQTQKKRKRGKNKSNSVSNDPLDAALLTLTKSALEKQRKDSRLVDVEQSTSLMESFSRSVMALKNSGSEHPRIEAAYHQKAFVCFLRKKEKHQLQKFKEEQDESNDEGSDV